MPLHWHGIDTMSFQSCTFQTTPGKKLSTSSYGYAMAITLAMLLLPGGGDKSGCCSGSGVQRDFLWNCPVESLTEKHGGADSPSIRIPPLHRSPDGEIQAIGVLFNDSFYLAIALYFSPPG